MDIRLIYYNASNQPVLIEEFDGVPNAVFTRLVTPSLPVGTTQLHLQVRCSGSSTGGGAYGASIEAQQAKR